MYTFGGILLAILVGALLGFYLGVLGVVLAIPVCGLIGMVGAGLQDENSVNF